MKANFLAMKTGKVKINPQKMQVLPLNMIWCFPDHFFHKTLQHCTVLSKHNYQNLNQPKALFSTDTLFFSHRSDQGQTFQ